MPEIARKAKADVAMIDTAVKDGKNLFAFLTVEQLKQFVDDAHDLGLKAGFAGSLKKEDLATVYTLGVDIAGFRGAVCAFGDRVNGRIDKEKVRELLEIKKRLETRIALHV